MGFFCILHLIFFDPLNDEKLSCHLFGKELLTRIISCNFVAKICLSIFTFDVWDKLWVLILSIPELSFLM